MFQTIHRKGEIGEETWELIVNGLAGMAPEQKEMRRIAKLAKRLREQPLINGACFYHIESQFTDLRRMDIVVDYGIQ
ncbi:MAG: hypothetical protein LBD79_08905 [Treponema sp.]|nr:hypothetical protein [Treponema sp.]